MEPVPADGSRTDVLPEDDSMPDGRPSAPIDADMADLDFSDGFDEEDT